MTIYYFIPIILEYSNNNFYWKRSFENKIDLRARDLVSAQKMAEQKFIEEKISNTNFFSPCLPIPSKVKAQKLITDYPNEITILVIENQSIYSKYENQEWVEVN